MGAAADPRSRLSALAPERLAAQIARQLLRDVGVDPSGFVDPASEWAPEHPAVTAARCGLMSLCGDADGEALICPAPLATYADGALAALAHLAPTGALDGLRGSQLLTERAALLGHGRQGRCSAGGASRLLDVADGAIALSLVRDDDWALIPAWLEAAGPVPPGDWAALTDTIRVYTMHDLVERGRELGLALCPVAPPSSKAAPWLRYFGGRGFTGAPVDVRRAPRVLDLSSLWAGPLCTHLLQRCGADVVKVESTHRPDGARRGPAAFFDLMHAGKRSVALDFRSEAGRAQLRALIAQADIVIEASRPRALRQLGIDAEALVRECPSLTWISITGYGRAEPQAQWIAYGDDAGVAAGLSRMMQAVYGQPVFVGDAIADPCTGLHAALAAWAGWLQGGAGLLSIALCDVMRHVVATDPVSGSLLDRAAFWRDRVTDGQRALRRAGVRPELPQARVPSGVAADMGAHTEDVLADWLG